LRISSLRISGYRNLAETVIDLEPDTTVIVGENNTGKTNVLDALYAGLRVNRTVRQGAFDASDYHLPERTSMVGDAGPIRIVATFAERTMDEWSPDISAAFGDLVAVSDAGLQSLKLQVSSTCASAGKDEDYNWAFLDDADNPRNNKHFTELNRLQTLRPLFSLGTFRDVSREFNQRSPFFGPFVNDPTFDEEVRDELVASLKSINDTVLAKHGAFGVLKENLDAGNLVIANDETDAVTIEAVPSRLSDLLANTQVSYQTGTGAALPLARQGSGTQSLSVLSLFRAFVAAKLADRMDPLSEPILTIEEPEAHLHPNASRALWPLLSALPGQRILTSHSGDLLSEVPLRSIRRLKREGTGTVCFRVNEAAFDEDEIRKINYHVRATRGELFFARAWLLVEGKSEHTALPLIARAIGQDLARRGVRIIEYSQCGGPAPYIKLADQLGISWHCLADNDAGGAVHAQNATQELGGRGRADYITALDSDNFESFMCVHGFLATYLPHVAHQKQAQIAAAPDTHEYCVQVADSLIKGRKEALALEVALLIEADPNRAPELLVHLLQRF
jgi:putative ATP-dependent endonuclease of OLD family